MEESSPRPPARDSMARRRVSPLTVAVVIAASIAVGGWWLSREEGLGGKPLQPEPAGHLSRIDGRFGAWGYNFENAVVDPKRLFPSRGLNRTPALSKPDLVPEAELAQTGFEASDGSWIAGVVVAGAARAYPGRILEQHDVIDDTLGGAPIAVAYDGFSDELSAFSRRVDGDVLEFGDSGLRLYTALVLYDRRLDPHDQSLWCPLLLQAISGPKAAPLRKLEPIDVERTTWADWLARHPETSLIGADTGFGLNYRSNNFETYYESDDLILPWGPGSGRRPGIPHKSKTLVISSGERRKAYLFADIVLAGGSIQDRLGAATFKISLAAAPFGPRAIVEPAAGSAAPIVRQYVSWFVWDALDPSGELFIRNAEEETRN